MNDMTMRIRCFGLLLLSASVCLQVQATDPKKPNIVFILVDDLGWKDLGCYGSTFYETPNIDKLSQSGMRFTQAYAAAPLCSATRAAILTGWSPARQHLIGVTPGSRKKYDGFKDYKSWRDEPEFKKSKAPLLTSKQLGQLNPDNSITIAERLKEKGYATAFIGKWHLGPDADKYPEKHGFDINVGGSHFGWPNSYFSPYKIPNLTDGPKGEYLTDRLTDESLAWMEKQHKQKKPFFLYLSHFTVHGPWQSKDEYTEYFEKKGDANDKQRNSIYAGMIKSLDDSVGRLMVRLRTLGIEKNTLVILASDNGGIIMKKDKKTGKNGT
jgi:arylsulfatase A